MSFMNLIIPKSSDKMTETLSIMSLRGRFDRGNLTVRDEIAS